jgi:hypothetical protein
MDIENLDPRDVAVMAIGAIGGTVEAYLESGYADPLLYKLVEFVEGLSESLEYRDLTERLTVLKMRTGEAVNEMIDANNIPIDKNEWSK